MMARKRSPIPRLADDCSREAATRRIGFAGTVREVMRTTPERLFRGCLELLGRNRPASRGFDSEKEASWTG
jgi:hypothetical protein